ncbi:MAG: hypothetical protein WCB52_19185 [Pseudolabrys sp.]
MLYSAIGAMGVGELLRHPGQRIPTDLDAGRKFVSGGGTLDEQHAHGGPNDCLSGRSLASGLGFQQPAELRCGGQQGQESQSENF